MTSSYKNDRRCFACKQPTQAVPIDHSDGRTSFLDDCINQECACGPGGLFTILTRQNDTGQITSATKFIDNGKFQNVNEGDPSENEANVENVAKMFMEAINRQYGTQYDKYNPGPLTSRAERGFDCEIISSQKNYSLRLQVTRALPGDVYQEQKKQRQRCFSLTVWEAADLVMVAIRRKAKHASSDIALVIDGVDAPFLAVITDIVVSTENQAELDGMAWHSVWVVGPMGARQLTSCKLP